MVNKWEIYFCDLNPAQGSEQRGVRPVLVISNNVVNHLLPVTTVLPLSSIKPGDKIYPTEIKLPAELSGLPKDSVAMVQQIRTISHSRLSDRAGVLIDSSMQDQVKAALRNYFEL
ncbi:MAG: type II toxin-antitoxin system PemK/MazF family toxin [Bacillota bacterium]|nr:type II toxin-antitoxin system PemK/MazF family toxin [Bacillota bacterium]